MYDYVYVWHTPPWWLSNHTYDTKMQSKLQFSLKKKRNQHDNHWNENVILTKFYSLAVLEVFIVTTSNAASDENFFKMKTFPFQWTSKQTLRLEEVSDTGPGFMMTSSNGNIFRVTGHLCGKFTGPRWISRTKASDAGLWCFLWFTPE